MLSRRIQSTSTFSKIFQTSSSTNMTNNFYPSTTSNILWDITQLLGEKKKLEMNTNNKIIYQNTWPKAKSNKRKIFPKISKTIGNNEGSSWVYANRRLIKWDANWKILVLSLAYCCVIFWHINLLTSNFIALEAACQLFF